MAKKYTSNRPLGGIRDAVGIGYIITPSNMPKKQYVEHCYRTGTVSLLLENGGVIDNVLIAKHILNEIDFPETFNAKGSQIVWINQPRKNQPIAIGSLSKTNEFVNFSKNKSSLRRATKDFVSEILVDADKGTVIITSNSSVEGGGDIYIISTNKDKTSKLNVNISADINISSQNFTLTNSKKLSFVIKDKDVDENITEISYEKEKGFSYKDEFGNEAYFNADHIQVKPNSKFNVGEGNEPAMLSETFKVMFEDYTDLLSQLALDISKLTVNTQMGPSTVPLTATKFAQYATDLNEIKTRFQDFQSKIHFTD